MILKNISVSLVEFIIKIFV